jgi:cobalt-precorrin-5B (C1)-methyltransferase
MLSDYVYKNQKKLRCGYTTGSCAAGAAKAAVRMLLTGMEVGEVSILTPKGIGLSLLVEDIFRDKEWVRCAVRKDAGDDADCTDGMLIYACVSFGGEGIGIDGGEGIGRVTKPGLEQPVGAAAINRVPREMIEHEVSQELLEAGYEGGVRVLISAPAGVEIAKKTLNSRLGIEGGISILGTSGIVEPMSETALVETIRIEMRQRKANGETVLLLSPGNYGQQFAKETWQLDLERSVKCSNFIGETLDFAVELGFEKVLLIGHIGKLVKIASGIMNTHSGMADARMETLCACALLAGCDAETARKVLMCTTTDEALGVMRGADWFENAMEIMVERMLSYMGHRTGGNMRIEVIVFSNVFGVLAESEGAENLVGEIRSFGNQT